MTKPQRYAIDHHCRLVGEMAHPRFVRWLSAERVTGIITVNSGYECIEQNYGGPVWHCSVAGRGQSVETLRAIAERELLGVGDSSLGEWSEWTGRAFHLRRRLAVVEEQITGPAIDIRGDAAEVWARLLPVRGILGPGWSRNTRP